MKLKQKTLLLVSASFLIFLILVGIIVRFTLLNTYTRIENSFINNNLTLIHNDIKESSESLSRLLGDWSAWDDTYYYTLGEYPEYIEDNMMDETFINLKLNFIWIGDISGNKLYSKYFDLTANKEIPFYESINSYIGKDSLILNEGINKRPLNGTVKIDDMSFIFSSYSITNSIGDNYPSGIMVMGVLIDNHWISDHSEKLNLPFDIYSSEDINLSSIKNKADLKDNNEILNVISLDSSDTYNAYSTIKDIKGENILIAKIKGTRTIYNAGKISLFWFMGVLFALMIVLVITFKFISGWFVINRLNYIETFIARYKTGNNIQEYLEVKGNDEISNLIEGINDMLLRFQIYDKHLLEAKINAEDSNKSKSEFLRNMSHELRTPLNHIIGFSQLMKDGIPGPVNDTQKEYLTDVLSSSSHLLSLINDLLDLSRIEAGKLTISTENIDLKETLTQTIDMFKEKVENNHQNILYSFGLLPNSIKIDKRMFIQIMYNLLSNAVKFTDSEGSINISAETSQNNKEIIISIKDTGIGLAAKSRDIIFESFGQVENNSTRKFEGTGLGLALTKNLVKLHGGRIWVESEGLGKGSTFSFTLPLA